jgi:hypothetical protein
MILLHRRKDIYWQFFFEDRRLFQCLADPTVEPRVRDTGKRQIRIANAQVTGEHGPNPDPDSVNFRMIYEAGSRAPDVILMTEFGSPADTPAATKTFALVAEKARRYHSY